MARSTVYVFVLVCCLAAFGCTKTNNTGFSVDNCGGKKCAPGEDCLNGQCVKLASTVGGKDDASVTGDPDATTDSKTGQEDPCRDCKPEPCEAKPGLPNTGISGLCDGTQCVDSCTPCKDNFSVNFTSSPLSCHTSCTSDNQCYPLIAKCNTQTNKCESVLLKNGSICEVHDQCESGHCVPAIGANATWVAGTKVCTERPGNVDCRPDGVAPDSNQFCHGGMIGTGECVKLVRTTVPQGNQCTQVCSGFVPQEGCPAGHQFLKEGNLEAAHREFTNRLKYDAADSACNFGAAMTTLFLSFQDTSLSFDTRCANPELSGSLYEILREIGGPPSGLQLSTKLFGPYGLLAALKRAREFDPSTVVTVKQIKKSQTGPDEVSNVAFSIDHVIVRDKSIRMVDVDTGRTLTIMCDSEKTFKQGVKTIIGERSNDPCWAWFALNPDEDEDTLRNFYTPKDDGQKSYFTWQIWSVLKDAKVKGSGSLELYKRSKNQQGEWVYDGDVAIQVNITNLADTLSDLDKDLATAGGDLIGIASDGQIGAAFILGKSPGYTFDTLKQIALKFDENNLFAIVNYLGAAAADPSFSHKLPGEMFHLPANVSFKFNYIDMQMLAAVFGVLRAGINYMGAYDWKFRPEDAIGETEVLCSPLSNAFNAKFMTADVKSSAYTIRQGNAKTFLTAAFTALSNAAAKAVSQTVDKECSQKPSTEAGLWGSANEPITICISEWTRLLPTQADGVTAMKNVIDGILKSITDGEQTLANFLTENGTAIKTKFSVLFAEFSNTHSPQPYECGPDGNSTHGNKYQSSNKNCDLASECGSPVALWSCNGGNQGAPGAKTGYCELDYDGCVTSADCQTGDVCDLANATNGIGRCRDEEMKLTDAYRDGWLGPMFAPNFLFEDNLSPTIKVVQQGAEPIDIKAEEVFTNMLTYISRSFTFLSDGDDEKN